MVCPLCEHEQDEGDSCEQCGRSWGPTSPPAAAGEPLEGLELTQVAAGSSAPILPLLHLDRGREEAPPVAPRSPGRVAIALTAEDEMKSRCPNCGLMGSSSGRCLECGVRLAASS